MTITAKTHIDNVFCRAVPYERKLRECGRRNRAAGNAKLGALLLLCFGTGCSELIGFKDVRLEGDGGMNSDGDSAIDAPFDARVDMMIDAPIPKIYAFHTDQAAVGNFGASGARVAADVRCQNKYNATPALMALNCPLANIHAFLQIDDVNDTLARLEVNYPIPQNATVYRGTDGVTPVANSWDDFVNPNANLLSPISTSGTAIPFWSGRSGGGNLHCTNWTVTTGQGNAGDVIQVASWTALTNPNCSSANQRLVCFCWL